MKLNSPELDRTIEAHMQMHHIVGLAVCRLQDSEIIWARGYGWADIATHKPMTPDGIQNIGSISKTFTCTALMQLWEKGLFQLDDPVNDYLPFKVRHPLHSTPITIRQLLTHTGTIADGPAYGASYACGDPTIALGDWLRGYLLPGGIYYDAERNFYPYAPGADWSYSNVAYGLLGYLCEVLSGEPLHQYCRKYVFAPLGMDNSGWMLSEIDTKKHTIPYALPGTPPEWQPLYALEPDPDGSDPIPLCLYSFPNYPDGLIRTSARQLAQYAAVFAASGKRQGQSVLKPETIQRCFTQEWPQDGPDDAGYIQGLTWRSRLQTGGSRLWGHDGGDPGINTRLQVRPADGAGVVIITNTNHSRESMDALAEMLWEAVL